MHPVLRVTHVKNILPGFGTALVLFSGYCAAGRNVWVLMSFILTLCGFVEWLMQPSSHESHHDEHNSDSHH
jgi:hypothetical protein